MSIRLKQFTGLLRCYAAIVFLDSPLLGLLFLVATLLFPNIGLSGMIAGFTGFVTARLLQFPALSSGLHIFNSLLVGLSLGAFFKLDIYLLCLIILGAILAVFLTVAIMDSLWRLARLPVLSVPFVLVALTMAFAARSFGSLTYYVTPMTLPGDWFGHWLDNFFSALGAIFFTPHPLVGAVLFIGILWRSRYLALLALTGYTVGTILLHLLSTHLPPNLIAWSGFNFALSAMAIGGIFTVPGWAGFLLAMTGAGIAALLTSAIQNLLLGYGLPVMAVPFLLATLTVLAALNKRTTLSIPLMAQEPGLPEINYERARLAKVRAGELGSVPLLIPFYGEWDVYQGFNGPHTHQPPWHHALDFYIKENGYSFRNSGTRLEDYNCYDLPVLSPAHGEVVRLYDKLPDNPPGEVDTKNNWGNFVLIRLDSGLHVLLAHLRQHSIKVKETDRVTPGMVLAACGNTGRSPQPHLHMQVQREATLGSPTHPFHLCSVIVHKPDGRPEYRVIARPEEGERIQQAEADERLATYLHLPVGRLLTYRLDGASLSGKLAKSLEQRLCVELTLLGQFRLHRDKAASAAFEEVNGVLAFYDRIGTQDVLLNMWLLNLGLTPFSEGAHHWRDAPAAALLPLNAWQRLWLALWRPLGCGLDSQYERNWDKKDNVWRQKGKHVLRLAGIEWTAHTEAILDPEQGCKSISLDFGNKHWQANLISTGLLGDQGIPGWQSGPVGWPVSSATNAGPGRGN